jgi:Domain of unknown function (DUF4150)
MTWPLEVSREIDEGIIISEPMDWCKSPTAIVPYRLFAYQREAMDCADSVRQTSDRTHVKGSIVRASYGDEPGVGGGVISGTHNAECTPKTWSQSVTAEGRNVVRHEDEWWMNHKNTWGLLHYVKDTSQGSTADTAKIDARMLALYKAPNTATDAPSVEAPAGPAEAPSAGSSALGRLGTTLGIASLGYGAGQMAGQYYLGQEGNVAVGITNYQMGQVSPFSPQGQAIGGALGFPGSMSRIDEANNFLSLKAGRPVDFRTMSPDQLDQLVRQPWPSPEQITKNGEALKTKTKPKPQPYPPPSPATGLSQLRQMPAGDGRLRCRFLQQD